MAISNNSRGMQPGVCTSTTRPTNPYEGFMIYETDTDKTLFWNGSAWVNVNSVSPAFTGTPTAPTAADGTNSTQLATMASRPWNTAWGFVAQFTAATTTTYTSDFSFLDFSFSAIANRRYKYTLSGLLACNTSGLCNPSLTTTAATTIRECLTTGVSGAYISQNFTYIETQASTATVSRSLRTGVSSGNWSFYGSNTRDAVAWKVSIEDIGPA